MMGIWATYCDAVAFRRVCRARFLRARSLVKRAMDHARENLHFTDISSLRICAARRANMTLAKSDAATRANLHLCARARKHRFVGFLRPTGLKTLPFIFVRSGGARRQLMALGVAR